MPRAKKDNKVREDELDWHEPLYDQKEFQRYALEIVFLAVGKKLASRRRVKARIAKTKMVDRWVDHALNYLVLYHKIHAEVRGEGITYFRLVTVAPPAVVRLPNLNENWSYGAPKNRRAPRPYHQQMTRRETA
jgi:hypothetical protein